MGWTPPPPPLFSLLEKNGKRMDVNSYAAYTIGQIHAAYQAGYEAGKKEQEIYKWPGPGPAPRRWTAPDGTIVYRSYEDYVDD